jgi:hypothetical protein
MRSVIIAAALVAAGMGLGSRGADAQALPYYPFCLFTGGDHSGFERCNYASFEQCLFDRRAEGGVCYSNPYLPAFEPPRRRIPGR